MNSSKIERHLSQAPPGLIKFQLAAYSLPHLQQLPGALGDHGVHTERDRAIEPCILPVLGDGVTHFRARLRSARVNIGDGAA